MIFETIVRELESPKMQFYPLYIQVSTSNISSEGFNNLVVKLFIFMCLHLPTWANTQ